VKIYQVEFSDYDEHSNYGCFFSREAAEEHMANLEAEGHGTAGDTLSVGEYEVEAHAPVWYSWYSIRASWGETLDDIEVWSHENRTYTPFNNTGSPYVSVQPRRPIHPGDHRYYPAAVHVTVQALDEVAGKALARTDMRQIGKECKEL
jgi:hypothetical protein